MHFFLIYSFTPELNGGVPVWFFDLEQGEGSVQVHGFLWIPNLLSCN